MKFSAKGEYGTRAILDIALYQNKNPVSVKDISKRQAIPERFLEQVMAALKKAELVESVRGAQGGYRLAKPAEKISLADVIVALEGPIILMECIAEGKEIRCDQTSLCVIRDAWKDVQASIVEVLKSVTVRDMVKKKREKEETLSHMYHI